jgi:hypothetical protein
MRVKGSAIASLPKFVDSKFGPDGLKRWKDSLSEEARGFYSEAILVSRWYPIKEAFIEPTRKCCELFYGGSLKGAWEMGRFSADIGLKGVYRLFIKFGSPGFIISRANTILTSYYEPSDGKVVESEKNRAILRLTQLPDKSDIFENRLCGWIERALELSGCRGVKLQITKSFAKGDDYSEFLVTWA